MQPTTASPNFSNIQSPPTVAQPASASPARISFSRNYLLSIPGILRILLIVSASYLQNNNWTRTCGEYVFYFQVFQFAAWISAAAVLKPPASISDLPPDFAQTRGAYLFFSIVGDFVAIIIFILHILNIVNLNGIKRIPWTLIVMATDFFWIIPTFVLAIVSAVKEGAQKDPNFGYSSVVNLGAFGSAAVSEISYNSQQILNCQGYNWLIWL